MEEAELCLFSICAKRYDIVRNHRIDSGYHFFSSRIERGDSVERKGARMTQDFSITVNGRPVRVAEGTSVAAAMMAANEPCRISVRGEARAPFCGMGICMECRATVNGVPHMRTCQLACTPGMEVVTE
jgi:sarcosine oxidase subunit alpha